MPHYLYRIQPTRPEMLDDGPTEREATIVREHFEYLQALTAAGTVLMAGRTLTTGERAFGIVILVAESEARAATIMRDDPAVREDVMRAELSPFRVALWSRGGPGTPDE